MKKNTIESIEKEIIEKTKLPINIKKEIYKEIFTNIMVAIIMISYIMAVILGSVGSEKNVRTIDLNVFSLIWLAVTIVLFEYSYKNKSKKIMSYGIETLFISILTLFLPYVIFELDNTYQKYYLLSSIYIAIYYIIKAIYMSIRIKSNYIDNISDIKEIVKKESLNPNKEKRNKQVNGKIKSNINTKDKTREKRKSSTKTSKSDIQKKDEMKQSEINKPKKRGRPRKAVIKSD